MTTFTPMQAAVRRLARPVQVRVLHPDPALDRRTVSIPEMARSSGGEQLTGAIQFGASPRASINLVAGARALAFLRGRSYALATDVEYLAPDVLRHRLVLNFHARADNS